MLLAASSAYGESSFKLIPVEPQQLYDLIVESDSMVIKESPMSNAQVLFKSTSLNDLRSFRESLILNKPKPEEYFHCMCTGTPAVYFYKNEKETVYLTNHHGKSIRCSLWSSDVAIANVDKWVKWFEEHGISSVREEVEYSKAQAKKCQKNLDKWTKAIPNPIKPLWKDAIGNYGDVDTKALISALRKGMPDKAQRILALLEWYGSGAGPWSGFPSYEDAAEKMLLEYTTKEIITAMQSTELTTAQVEGGARLFGGWTFFKKRPNGLNEVPQEIKKMFWNHVKSTEDEDKFGRAKRAFTQ
jgi:hypothetical protein